MPALGQPCPQEADKLGGQTSASQETENHSLCSCINSSAKLGAARPTSRGSPGVNCISVCEALGSGPTRDQGSLSQD